MWDFRLRNSRKEPNSYQTSPQDLEGGQVVRFRDPGLVADIIARTGADATLTEWFKANAHYPAKYRDFLGYIGWLMGSASGLLGVRRNT